MTNEYASALAAHNEASKSFRAVQSAYRSLAIGDAEYLAGRAAFEKATAIYDAAFAAEAAIEETIEEVVDDSQMALF